MCYIPAVIVWQEQQYFDKSLKDVLFYNKGTYGHTYSRLHEVDTIKNIDLLFIGSSHAYRSFDTRIYDSLEIKSFNLGTSSQTPIQTMYLVEKYLDQLNPKYVVFEVYPITTFELDGVESALDLVSNGDVDLDMIKMIFSVNEWTVYNTFIYAAYRQLFDLDVDFRELISKDNDTYISGGYVEKQIKHYQAELEEEKHWVMEGQQVRNFECLLKLLIERKIPVLLVQSPITKSRYDSFQNNQELDQIFNSYGNYLNFNNLMNLDDSLDFYDAHHLNQIGVRKFNALLIEELKEKEWF